MTTPTTAFARELIATDIGTTVSVDWKFAQSQVTARVTGIVQSIQHIKGSTTLTLIGKNASGHGEAFIVPGDLVVTREAVTA